MILEPVDLAEEAVGAEEVLRLELLEPAML
jgi:hypothetical protein